MLATKFRAKRVDNNEWIYGFLIRSGDHTYISEYVMVMEREMINEEEVEEDDAEPIFYDGLKLGMFHLVDEKTIGQFTGVTDKNKKEVYTTDIVLQSTNNGKKPYEVKFDFGCFYAGFHTGSSTQRRPKLLNNKVVVIGNIHETPELVNDN